MQTLQYYGAKLSPRHIIRGDCPLPAVERIKPVFVDIAPTTLNLDPDQDRSCHPHPSTTAIMPCIAMGIPAM